MSKKALILIGTFVLISLAFFVVKGHLFLHDNKLHVVFCDVGQGDGIILKSPQGKIILVDGGPDESFSRCLSRHLPFWQRTIELILISHPHADHYVGFLPIVETYHINHVGVEDLVSTQQAYQLFLSSLHDKKIPIKTLRPGDMYRIGELRMRVIGPSNELLERSSPNGTIGESREFGSLLLLVEYGKTSFLLTGDSQAAEIEEAKGFGLRSLTVLQAPHHGSATGLTQSIISTLQPNFGVLSVGADNRYGHPALSILKLFEEAKIPIMRTDQLGDIELVSNGKEVKVISSQRVQ